MDTLHTASADSDATNKNETTKKDEEDEYRTKLEAMVTAEQVISASVARKRRNISKKRSASAHMTREQTPGREILEKTTSENSEKRPKTPERKHRKPRKIVSKSTDDEYKETIPGNGEINALEEQTTKKRNSLVDIPQVEVFALLNKAKRSISSTIEKRQRKKLEKCTAKQRSSSTPGQISESDLIERLRKAQIEQDKFVSYSSSSSERESPKPLKPAAQRFVAQNRKQRQYSQKVVEIIDPNSFMLALTETPKPKYRIIQFFQYIQRFTLIELCRDFQAYKIERKLEYDKIRKLRKICFNELFVLIIILGLGAIIFKFTEGAFENYYKCGVKRVKRDFIDNLWYKSHNLREDEWKSLARNKLRIFEEELHTAHEAGVRTYSGQRSWSFFNAIVYTLTIVTTIGYGHMYPTTTTGMALTIVYALIGIPLFLIILTDFGKLFTRCIKFVWSFVRRVYYTGSCRRVRKTAHVQEIFKGAQMMYEIATFRRPSQYNIDQEDLPQGPSQTNVTPTSVHSNQMMERTSASDNLTPTTPAISNFEIDDQFNLPVTLAIFILVLYILLGALIFSSLEGWAFFDSFYFVFISMSTIGFGDFVPHHPLFMIASIVYLIFGLALMSMCINVVQDKLSDTFKHASAKLGATIGFKVDEQDGSITTIPPPGVPLAEVHCNEKSPNMVEETASNKL